MTSPKQLLSTSVNLVLLVGIGTLSSTLILTPAYADSNAHNTQQTIKDIRKRYQTVNATISSKGCQSTKSLDPNQYDTQEAYSKVYCPYYHSVFSENQRNKPVSAVGVKRVHTDFWLTDEAGEYRLQKVNRTTTLSYPQKISQEYLYDDNNQLIFYYKHDPIYGGSSGSKDTRLYFNNGRLIKAMPQSTPANEVKQVQQRAKLLVQMAEF